MKKCIVIGGGFAGLTSAVYLSRAGFNVELVEASPKPGGRAYSFIDGVTGDEVDNGQHIMMGCYKETLKFLSIIDSLQFVDIQKKLEVNFVKENFALFKLRASNHPYPLNLLFGLLNYTALSIRERLSLLKFFVKIYTYNSERLKSLTVNEWLRIELQNDNTIKSFWEILTVGALNTDIKYASAFLFSEILKEIFFRGSAAASIVLPRAGLSSVYCNNAVAFIEKHNGRISLSERVEELAGSGNKLEKVKTNKRILDDFDYVVSAVPHHAFEKIAVNLNCQAVNLNYSAIVSLHVWLKTNPFKEKFYGLINSPVHWIFNHGSYISLVISGADYLAGRDKEFITDIASSELEKFTPVRKTDIVRVLVIKEKRATFVPENEVLKSRPGAGTEYSNLFIAGDWTDTGLPATIEGAVKSGRVAAEKIIHTR